MSKMQEAWLAECKKFNLEPAYNTIWQKKFEAGYQAAIAGVKAGGAVAQFNWNEAKFEWLTPYKYSENHLTPLYKLPEDTP